MQGILKRQTAIGLLFVLLTLASVPTTIAFKGDANPVLVSQAGVESVSTPAIKHVSQSKTDLTPAPAADADEWLTPGIMVLYLGMVFVIVFGLCLIGVAVLAGLTALGVIGNDVLKRYVEAKWLHKLNKLTYVIIILLAVLFCYIALALLNHFLNLGYSTFAMVVASLGIGVLGGAIVIITVSLFLYVLKRIWLSSVDTR